MRLGIVRTGGPLGASIRERAFLYVPELTNNEIEVIEINLSRIAHGKLGKLAAVIHEPLKLFKNISDIDIAKKEVFTSYAAKFIDKKIEEEKIDLIQAETTLCAYIWVKSLKKVPCIFDMHGLTYEQKNRMGIIKNSKEDEYEKNCQERVIEESNHIFSVSSYMTEYLQRYVTKSKITEVPNGGEILPYKAEYTAELNLIYAGILEYWERVEDYIELSKNYKRGKCYLMGDGRLKEGILKNKGKIEYLGSLKRDDALKKMSEFQIGIAPSTEDITRKVACPIKVFDYMSVGLPVLTPNVGEWSEIVKKYNCGIVIEHNEPSEYLKALDRIDENLWNEMSHNCKKLIMEKYNWQTIIKERAVPVYRGFL